jgi:phenylpropionate dioxygenase-like ring-hydroxylating dioxygenase large terminal subunit
MKQGMSSEVSPLTSELLKQDSHALPSGLAMHGDHVPPVTPIPFTRYYDPEFAKLENEKLWSKSWQFACRTEDIPNVGDRVPYDVGNFMSYVIVRSGPNEFRAFNNACLHRGTRLVNAPVSGDSIRCPFHGWEWNPDGSLKNIPSSWDFAGVSADKYRLPEAKVEVWEGFIFINPDPEAKPLSTVMGVMPEAFKDRGHGDRFTFAHVSKKIRANWKILQEAFLESYHVVETHSDSLSFTGDASTKYDIWESDDGHVSRLITPSAVPSPHLGDEASVQQAVDGVAMFFKMAMPGVEMPNFDAAKGNVRAQLAAWRRTNMGQMLGRDFSDRCDSELIDSTQFYLFPNFFPWFGDGLPLVYQFLPLGDNPNESVMNVRLTAPIPGNGVRPPPVKINHLDFDEFFSDKAPEFGPLTHIFDQDLSNLPNIQRGLKLAHPSHSKNTLGRYQESRIQHFQNVLSKTLGLE